jgi:hypothetical protein
MKLAGRWNAEFRINGAHEALAKGAIELTESPVKPEQCPAGLDACARAARGTHNLPVKTLLGHDISSEVLAGIDDRGDAIFLIGGCCDRGEISARGSIRDHRIAGSWQETYVGGGKEGTFVLTPGT